MIITVTDEKHYRKGWFFPEPVVRKDRLLMSAEHKRILVIKRNLRAHKDNVPIKIEPDHEQDDDSKT